MAKRTFQAINETIDGLKIEDFDDAIFQLARVFDDHYVYSVGRYVIHNDGIYQRIVPPIQRNLIKQPYSEQLSIGNTIERNGITWTINQDSSITADGTATSDSEFICGSVNLSANTYYTLSGCPNTGSSSTFYIYIDSSTIDTGEGVTFLNSTATTASIKLKVLNNTEVEDIIFYPQIEIGQDKTAYQRPNKFTEGWVADHWRLVKNL